MVDPAPPSPSEEHLAGSPRVFTRWGMLFALLGLTGFAISQPLLSLLGSEPSFFAFRNIEGGALVWFALGVALFPPLALWAVTVGVGVLHAPTGRSLHLATVALLLTLLLIPIARSTGVPPVLVAVLALLIGIAGAVAYSRFAAVGMWLRYASFLPVFAVGSFLLLSDTSDLLESEKSLDPVAENASPVADSPPIVVLLLDEFPTQVLLDEQAEIDPVRFPFLAEFGEDATWYRDFTTVSSVTTAALPSLLTGLDPTGEDLVWTNYPDSIFSLLAPTHHLTVFESLSDLCGLDTCGEGGPTEAIRTPEPQYRALIDDTISVWRERVSLDDDSVVVYDDFQERVGGLADAEVAVDFGSGGFADILEAAQAEVASTPTRFVDFVETFTPSDKPTLYFLHLLLPHTPWLFYDDGTDYEAPLIPPDWSTPWTLAVEEQRLLLQAQYADSLLGIALDTLKRSGVYDEAVVVVLADHGINLTADDFDRRSVSDDALSSVAYAPLLIKAPGQTQGRVSDENLLGVDLVPTIADLAGVPIGWEVDGHPAGSAEIANRGTNKYIFGLRGLKVDVDNRREFDSDAFRPDVDNRWIAPIAEGAPVLAGLHELLEVDVVGRRLDDLVTGPGGSARVNRLAELQASPSDRAPLGVVLGHLPDAPARGTVVFAVDGTVVGGSPLFELDGGPGTFMILLPPGSLDPQGNDIRMAVFADGEYRELDLEER